MLKPLLLFRRYLFFGILLGYLCLTQAYAQQEVETARNYLQSNVAKLKLVPNDLSEMTISSAYLSPTTGWYHVYFNQRHQGVDVYNAVANVTLKQGNVGYSNTSFIPNIAAMANFDSPVISPLQALGAVAADLKLNLGQPKEMSRTNLPGGGVASIAFLDEGVSESNIPVKLYWVQTRKQVSEEKSVIQVQLAWNIRVEMKGHQNIWNVHVDALTGQILEKRDDVIHCYFGMRNHTTAPHICALEPSSPNAVTGPSTVLGTTPNTYNVFDYPIESPIYGSHTTVTNPFTKFAPSGTGPGATNGWHNDGSTDHTTTRGNNVWAQEDVNANNGTGASPTSSILNFEFPYVTGVGSQAAKQDAAITNLFYWNNVMHDVLWKYGFDEPSGNFQNNNQGRGGAGGDYVFADAQDGAGVNNANFSTPVDGGNGRMQMFMWDLSTSDDLDGDFDNGIIAHEYGHGWSTRLTGGPANSSCLQNAEQGGEGWSDYASLMLTTNWSLLSPTVTSANLKRGIGNYALNQTTSGKGIRAFPYSYDMTVNGDFTYGKVATYPVPHGVGSIWAAMLWDMTWEIIMQDNQIVNNIFDLPTNVSDMKGNIAAMKLVNEGLRLQPCSPSFIDSRDAILAADVLLFGGRYRCAIGRAFARRGLGANASTGASSNDQIVFEDFTPITGTTLTSSLTPPAICSNTAFNYTSTIGATGSYTFNWSRAAVTGISNTAGSGASATINETLINTTSLPVTVEYQFVVSPDACGGTPTPQKVKVVVNPAPIPTVGSYAVCLNGSVPSGEGLVVNNATKDNFNGQITASSGTYLRGQGNNATVYTLETLSGAGNVYYQTITFVSPVTANVTFETSQGTLSPRSPGDTYMTLYQTSFNPSAPATNFLRGDDDSGVSLHSKFTHSLVQGQTYVLVVSTFYNGVTGTYLLTSSLPVFRDINSWYKVSSGGTALATGEVFNPVGVTNSGITNTATAGIHTFYVASNAYDACRTATTFSINPVHSITLSSASATESQTVCQNGAITPITYTLGGGATGADVTGIPTGVTAVVSGSTLTISGSPTVTGTFNYNIVTTGNSCTTASESGTIVVNAMPTISLTSSVGTNAQTVCANTAINSITYGFGVGATGATVDGLPSGVTGSVSGSVLTISGTPSVSGTFNYTVTTSGPNCTPVSLTGSIVVNPVHTITLLSVSATESQTVCINSGITSITYTLGGGATGADVTGLPSGVTKSVSGTTLTLSGIPTQSGTFNYSILTIGNSCTTASESGTIEVKPLQTVNLTSSVGTNAQTVCANAAITSITYGFGGSATGATVNGLPSGVIGSVSGSVLTISGTPTVSGTFNYTVTTSGPNCTPVSLTGSIVVNPVHTITLSSVSATESQTVCINSGITSITYTLGGGATGADVTGLPTGVTKSVSGTTLTISGIPTQSGTFNYSIVTTGNSCTTASESGTIEVKPLQTVNLTSSVGTNAQTVCANAAITSITYGFGGSATGATVDGLPSGVTGSVSGSVLTISGTPSVSGTFNYTVTTSGANCAPVSLTGSIVVNPVHTITLSSVSATESQTVCINSGITSITYTLGGSATGADVTGLPSGVTKSVSGTTLTISGIPTQSGTFNYSIVTTGNSCTTASESGTIEVKELPTLSLSSALGTNNQSLCINTPITGISYGLGGSATGATVSGLPSGVTASVTGKVLTISGTPTEIGPFNYTITTTGAVCSPVTLTGTIVINPNHSITLSSLPTTEPQTVCINNNLIPISYQLAGGASGATITGLPTGVSSTVSGGVIFINGKPTVSGTFTFTMNSTGNSCLSATKTGTIRVQTKPTITLGVNGETFNEGNSVTLCDIDANPSNVLTKNVTTSCVVGNPVWRVQIGAGEWSAWSNDVPATQLSDNKPYKYQAACDGACSSTYTSVISVTINYRASVPQNVSLVADGVTVKAGESKTICNVEGIGMTINATCGTGELILYSVDGGEYTTVVPSQQEDGKVHNYRVRCRKAAGTPSCVETESSAMSITILPMTQAPTASLSPSSGCGNSVAMIGTANCGALTTIWYDASTNQALTALPSMTPSESKSYYARCKNSEGCLSASSAVVTFTYTPLGTPPVVSANNDNVCAGTSVQLSTNCPTGTTVLWNDNVTSSTLTVSFNNVTMQSYTARCITAEGCMSGWSKAKVIQWKAFELTFINVGTSKSGVKSGSGVEKSAWSSNFITKDGGPDLDWSTQAEPTLYFSENVNKTAPRYWTIHVETCALGTSGSLTFNMLATPEVGVPRSFNTHENNAPYLMYANRDGFTELYAQNHPAYGFYEDNGAGGNVYDEGLPKGLYKLGVRYWNQKGQGSIYPSTRQPQGEVLAYQEYWFRIQSKDGVGKGAARTATSGQPLAESDKLSNSFAQVMPNPVHKTLRLKVTQSKGETIKAELVDVTGRSILSRGFVAETNEHQEEFEVEKLVDGMYFLRVSTSNKEATLKVVKM